MGNRRMQRWVDSSSGGSSGGGRQRASALVAAAAASAEQQQQQQQQQRATRASFEQYILDLQRRIIEDAEALDGSGAKFVHDRWERSPGDPNAGYGITSVLEGGSVLEKAAANISVVAGVLSKERAAAMSSRGRAAIDPAGGQPYSAAAMSLVFHSAHPRIPTLRADVRLFEVAGQQWYGGGCDLTPFYPCDQDFAEFHAFWKAACDAHDPKLYPEFKAWCDRYFYIPARKEHRGVGGLFFDDVEASAAAGYDVEQFVRDVGDGILPSWTNIVQRRRAEPFTDAERQWQLLRRGRYLEFNLLYDRGVKFGLDGSRVESIMVSAPPLIAWRYNVQPEAGSEEAALVDLLRSPRDWA
ncbi:coproporphyrinogen III oxidase [Micractinium conductrix]|uniref:Coproporphyrinogen III oxidase n=1 Tax=Micractinium conductrix TaxID=554055 RepID=A0A2P6VQ28_9CHLO|nr:coproporphyrinogen III oxidase [Micractinium conductrix]|eukprot:PSC76177.1 coproporphyrinogen III oxidase [Micractinium conductrix]